MKHNISVILILIFTLLFACGCQQNGFELSSGGNTAFSYSKDIFAMNTFMTVKAYGPEAEDAVNKCTSLLSELDSQLSATKVNSKIYKVNNRTDNGVLDAPANIIAGSLKLSELTEGTFDITVYPLVKAWGFTTGTYRVPDDSEVTELLGHIGYKKMSLTPDYAAGVYRVNFDDDIMQIDLGAIARGYAGDRIKELLLSKGITSAYCDLGGTMLLMGTDNSSLYGTTGSGEYREETSWNVSIKDPKDPTSTVGTLLVKDKFISNSNIHEQSFESDGKVYGHIIDPFTGYPADSGLSSVTVVSEKGAESDVLSTALCVMGFERARKFWADKVLDFEAVFITDDGRILVTEGIAEDYKASPGKKFSIVKNTD